MSHQPRSGSPRALLRNCSMARPLLPSVRMLRGRPFRIAGPPLPASDQERPHASVSLQVDRPARGDVDDVTDTEPRRLAHLERAGDASRLQAAGHIDGVAPQVVAELL